MHLMLISLPFVFVRGGTDFSTCFGHLLSAIFGRDHTTLIALPMHHPEKCRKTLDLIARSAILRFLDILAHRLTIVCTVNCFLSKCHTSAS
jgi:hypothetical protein